jgi:hypothetical protein
MQQVLEDIPMLLALNTFWTVFPLDQLLDDDRRVDCMHMLSCQRLFFVSYFYTLGREVLNSVPLMRTCAGILEEWEQVNALPAGIAFSAETCQIGPKNASARSGIVVHGSGMLLETGQSFKPKSIPPARNKVADVNKDENNEIIRDEQDKPDSDKENAGQRVFNNSTNVEKLDIRKLKILPDDGSDLDEEDENMIKGKVTIRAVGGGRSNTLISKRSIEGNNILTVASMSDSDLLSASETPSALRAKTTLQTIPSNLSDSIDEILQQHQSGNSLTTNVKPQLIKPIPLVDPAALLFLIEASLPSEHTGLRLSFQQVQSLLFAHSELTVLCRRLKLDTLHAMTCTSV